MSEQAADTRTDVLDDQAEAQVDAGLALMRQGALLAAASPSPGTALRRVEQSGHFRLKACASLAEFGERKGASAWETKQLVGLGRTLEVCPEVEARFSEGRVSLDCTATLGAVYANPKLRRPGDDWLGWAETESARKLRGRYRACLEELWRLEELRLGDEPAVRLTVTIAARARADFDRAHVIASRKADRLLTQGETFERVVEHYLTSFDETRRREGSRRLPHTATVPGRKVPAAVRRVLAARNGDRCAVPGCDHRLFLENAHIVPHVRGGHREADNLVRLCTQHHRMYDAGLLRIEGTASNPRFYDRHGRPLGAREGRRMAESTGPPAEPR